VYYHRRRADIEAVRATDGNGWKEFGIYSPDYSLKGEGVVT
jgi:hypothetical protein